MSKAVDLAARAKAAGERVKKAPVANTPMSKKVRLSVDIDPEPYRWLMSWCQDVAFAVGRARVNHVWVFRILLSELSHDKELQKRVIERVMEEHVQA